MKVNINLCGCFLPLRKKILAVSLLLCVLLMLLQTSFTRAVRPLHEHLGTEGPNKNEEEEKQFLDDDLESLYGGPAHMESIQDLLYTKQILPHVFSPNTDIDLQYSLKVMYDGSHRPIQGLCDVTMNLKDVEEPPEKVFFVPTGSHTFQTHSDRFALFLINPDVPSRSNPSQRAFLHWAVVNIQFSGDPSLHYGDIALPWEQGEQIARYTLAPTSHGTEGQRYIFLMFKYQGDKDFSQYSFASRGRFRVEDFANNYGLGSIVAMACFEAVSQNK